MGQNSFSYLKGECSPSFRFARRFQAWAVGVWIDVLEVSFDLFFNNWGVQPWGRFLSSSPKIYTVNIVFCALTLLFWYIRWLCWHLYSFIGHRWSSERFSRTVKFFFSWEQGWWTPSVKAHILHWRNGTPIARALSYPYCLGNSLRRRILA